MFALGGGGWAMLTLLSAYMTSSGYLHTADVLAALPAPVVAILLALVVHFWPRTLGRFWPWCLPAYLVAGGPVFLLLLNWLDQHYNH